MRIEVTVAGSLPQSAETGGVHGSCGCVDPLRGHQGASVRLLGVNMRDVLRRFGVGMTLILVLLGGAPALLQGPGSCPPAAEQAGLTERLGCP